MVRLSSSCGIQKFSGYQIHSLLGKLREYFRRVAIDSIEKICWKFFWQRTLRVRVEFELSLFPPKIRSNERIEAILDHFIKIDAVSASMSNGVSALSSHKLPFRGFVDPRDPFAGRGITGVYFGLARTVDPAGGGTFARFRDAADLVRARARARVSRASRNGGHSETGREHDVAQPSNGNLLMAADVDASREFCSLFPRRSISRERECAPRCVSMHSDLPRDLP